MIQWHDVISALIGAVLSTVLAFLTIGVFKLVATVNDLSARVARIEGWIWPKTQKENKS